MLLMGLSCRAQHLMFLKKLDTVAGVSDHDLLYSQDAEPTPDISEVPRDVVGGNGRCAPFLQNRGRCAVELS